MFFEFKLKLHDIARALLKAIHLANSAMARAGNARDSGRTVILLQFIFFQKRKNEKKVAVLRCPLPATTTAKMEVRSYNYRFANKSKVNKLFKYYYLFKSYLFFEFL